MTENMLAASGGRPEGVPEKFWDPEANAVRLEALLKSYLDLERRMGSSARVPGRDAAPEEVAAFRRAMGVPDSADAYQIAVRHEMLNPDPDVNGRLHQAGFSQAQAQLVYDLAAERLLPMIGELAAHYDAERELARLTQHFGGEEKWSEIARQLRAWGAKNLPKDVLAALGASFEGVVALYRMMTSKEPGLRGGMGGQDPVTEEQLGKMMEDPRYWRDHDPAFVGRVQEGFKKLYPD